MTLTRRGLLAAGATAGASALAGCTDFVADSLSSDRATVARAALQETGYAERTVEEVVVERTVGRFGLERTIEARNWYAEYDRAIALDALGLGRLQASVVSVLTTPQVSVLGKTFNPVGDYSTDELVALIQSRYDELEGVERVGEESVSVLGTETTLVRYRAEARLIDAGTTVDVFLQVSEPVAHGDDFVIGVAVFPQARGFETESGNVRTLLEALEHG
ncbi:hypothetical protein Htur_0063 [Haloterrigena turkmenica DSM 5511]|uniref:Lipoprotein n=1 Tax=Haloterrigena turkmenica (strain ATCC 51198 / DSM 5511 / JCM 9101 / NCIMB 13204 / VKM B-1734 / 4k) TaxID=543526 RepID=D2RTC1_HALTV|nr:DUF6517 family protein [Haloterrigena turkmenica]ADB58964.1 hypothetical protein Htur_0063 [Haloterrigena turkmenica DSM 5511]